MKTLRTITLLALFAAAPALAQDGSGPAPAPGDKPADAPSAPKDAAAEGAKATECRVDPAARGAIEEHARKVHFPFAAMKPMRAKASADVASFGGKYVFSLDWSDKGEMAVDVEIPEAMREAYPEEQLGMVKAQSRQFLEISAGPLLKPMTRYFGDFHVEHAEIGGKKVVQLTAATEKANAEKIVLEFNDQGLVSRQVITPRIDPDSPNAAFLAGADIVVEYTYSKRGDRYTIDALGLTIPMGQVDSKLEYYELPDGSFVPKAATVNTAFLAEELTVDFHDYVIDGKPVPETKQKSEKPSTEGEKPAAPPATDTPPSPEPQK